MKRLFLIITVFTIIFSCSACKTENNNGKITVAVSIAPQEEFVEKICGDKVNIVTQIPAGASAENYQLSPREITELNRAEIYFSIGVPAEESGILPKVSKNTEIISLSDAVNKEYPDLKIGNTRDPHIWLSVKRVKVMVNKIAEEMAALDPANEKFYKNNARNYCTELDELFNYSTAKLQNSKNRMFFVFHPAFAYLADDFSLKMYALEEHGHEATVKELAQLAKTAKENNVKVIFCQEEASLKQAKVFASEIGGRVEILKPLSPDYIENYKVMIDLISKAVTQ